MKLRSVPVIALMLGTCMLAGCEATENDWKGARDANTVAVYSHFLAKHPNGAHAGEARAAIDDLDWSSAKSHNGTADYDGYLMKYPSGRHAGDARSAIDIAL
jgi:hypothetical protein